MGRIHRPWTLSDVVQLLLEEPRRTITKSVLYKRINGDRYPEEWKALFTSIAVESISDKSRFAVRVNPDTGAQEIVLIDRGY